MAFGFPAFHQESHPVREGVASIPISVKEALSELSWKVKEERANQIIASVGMGFRSWGETMIINFLPDDRISVTSKCAFQILDWGKNKENVERFLVEFERQLS